ncbi:MAG: histidine kinase [Actinomycetota bacterium]
MAQPLKKADEEAVERTIQLFVFNQVSVLIAMAAGVIFYVVWVDSPFLVAGFLYLCGLFTAIEWAKRRLTVASLSTVGVFILVSNWITAVVLTLIVPFSFPLGILQILSPVIAAGPVLERPALMRTLIGGVVLSAVVTAIGLHPHESEIEAEIPAGAAMAIAAGGVAVMTAPFLIGAWDAHERQRETLRQALEANELIQDSRRRLVRAADDERRRVERNLHDGAQQQLVAVAMQLRLLRTQIDEPDTIDPVVDDLEHALEELRDLAHGLYPPLLRSRGLGEALRSIGRRSPIDIDVSAVEGRFPADIEAAVYFCCVEAVQNATKHAGEQAKVIIELDLIEGELRGSVADDGPGFEPSDAEGGVGLRNMEDRIGAVGGRLWIDTDAGTTVRFHLPVDDPGPD